MRFVFTTIMVASFFVLPGGVSVEAQVIRKYQRRFIGDIGYAAVDRRGTPIVVMNPLACRRLGPQLCSFFEAHERAHHTLKHFNRNISVQQKEAEADRYAATVVSPAARSAAQSYFAAGWGSSRQHGSSRQRLARVSNPRPSSIRSGRLNRVSSRPQIQSNSVSSVTTSGSRRVLVPTRVRGNVYFGN